MAHKLKAQWKAAKKMLTDKNIDIPKIGKLARFKLYSTNRKAISETFDALDGALDAGNGKLAKKLFNELKPKVSAFVKAADDMKSELGSGDTYTTLKNVISEINGLVMVCRAEVAELKDSTGESSDKLNAKRLDQWEKKLDEMTNLVLEQVGAMNNVGVTIGGIGDAFQKMLRKQQELDVAIKAGDPKAAENFAAAERSFGFPAEELTKRSVDFAKVESSLKKLLPAMEKYIKRTGMETLAEGEVYPRAQALLKDTPKGLAVLKKDLGELEELAGKVTVRFSVLRKALNG